MILLDSSVVVEYLRAPGGKLQRLFAQLRPAVCGVVRAEVLHGARDLAHLNVLTSALDQLPQHPTPHDIWDEVGRNLCKLRLRGLVVPFPDALIATLAIRDGIEVWTYDNHFRSMQGVLTALQLFAEPP
jgi:hypothetical protein